MKRLLPKHFLIGTSFLGPSHHGGRGGPDLQKLGLKFGGQISITSTGNQGKKMVGGVAADGHGVSIVKLKGDVPVGSPVNIRESHKDHQVDTMCSKKLNTYQRKTNFFLMFSTSSFNLVALVTEGDWTF